jgi:hypothetical protein
VHPHCCALREVELGVHPLCVLRLY